MKQQIVLLYTALFLFGFARAQVSKESYDKAIDFLNCKTVELSLQGNEYLDKFQQQCPCNEVNNTQINQFLTSVGKFDATIALSNEVENLKKSFKQDWTKDEVVTFLSGNIFENNMKYQKIIAFAKKRKGKIEFDNFKTGLKTNLSANLVENTSPQYFAPKNSENLQQTLGRRTAQFKNNQNNQIDDNGILGGYADYLIIFSFLLGVISLLRIFRIQFSYQTIMPDILKSEQLRQLIIEQSGFSRASPSSQPSSAQLKEAFRRITDLEVEIIQLKDKIGSQSTTSNISAYLPQPTFQESKDLEIKTEIFFLSTPNSDGSFNESSSSSTYRDGASIYRFTKIGGYRAKFQIDDKDASARLALLYPDKNIDPVCDAINAFNPKSTRITTVEQGEAELQNGKWVVDRNKKAKIKYEN